MPPRLFPMLCVFVNMGLVGSSLVAQTNDSTHQQRFTFTTTDGKTYDQARVTRVNSESAIVTTTEGIFTVSLATLPENVVAQLGSVLQSDTEPENASVTSAAKSSQDRISLLDATVVRDFPGPFFNAHSTVRYSLAVDLPVGFFVSRDLVFPKGGKFLVTDIVRALGRENYFLTLGEAAIQIPMRADLVFKLVENPDGDLESSNRFPEVTLCVPYRIVDPYPKVARTWPKEPAILRFDQAKEGAIRNTKVALLAFAASSITSARPAFVRSYASNVPSAFWEPAPIQLSDTDLRLIVLLIGDGEILDHKVVSVGFDSLPDEDPRIRLRYLSWFWFLSSRSASKVLRVAERSIEWSAFFPLV